MAHAAYSSGLEIPRIRLRPLDRPRAWLAAGWRDLRSAPQVSLTYGLIFALMGAVLTLGLASTHLLPWLVPVAFSFVLLGPILAVGLYDVSRRLRLGRHPTLGSALGAWSVNRSQISFMGITLLVFLLTWLLVANLIFALFYRHAISNWQGFYSEVFLSGGNLLFLAIGGTVGAVFAALVFSFTAISIPMLLDRETDVVTAIVTSVRAVQQNPGLMAIWAGLILGLTTIGLLTAYLGLVITLPLIGHASWHAYQDLVEH
ncbi:MAG: hypothetical protein B7Z66_02985 [Chromatiales bacterium 21-64-14]|nr:MAG: hypothetical protein B7Z66_02985 [Chromatiales bacterium 21-64-14]HQU15704.1 DUF2189 domain-containing protein [Gammaproteobacteria bacterium]